MYPIYHQIGKARIADWHAQAQRDALARAVRRAGREQRPPSAARRLLSGQLQSWRDTLGTLAGPAVSQILGWSARTESNPPAPGPDPAPGNPAAALNASHRRLAVNTARQHQ